MKFILFFSIPLLALLASCSSTPTSRIEQNPAIYRSLSPKQQDLVSKGQIERGMTKPAVFLAMGNPDGKIDGNRNGKTYERWDYTQMVPVYSGGFSPYYGYGHGYYGYGSSYGIGYIPSVHYVPRRGSSVDFSNGKVTGWNTVRRNF